MIIYTFIGASECYLGVNMHVWLLWLSSFRPHGAQQKIYSLWLLRRHSLPRHAQGSSSPFCAPPSQCGFQLTTEQDRTGPQWTVRTAERTTEAPQELYTTRIMNQEKCRQHYQRPEHIHIYRRALSILFMLMFIVNLFIFIHFLPLSPTTTAGNILSINQYSPNV